MTHSIVRCNPLTLPKNKATSLWDYKKVCVSETLNDPSDAFNNRYSQVANTLKWWTWQVCWLLSCGANQIAYTDVGSTDKHSEQSLDLRNTANKTLPSWLLPKLTAHALEASSRPDAILLLPSTVCSSRVTTRNSNSQQLAEDKNWIQTSGRFTWLSLNFVKTLGLIPNSKKQKHSTACLLPT